MILWALTIFAITGLSIKYVAAVKNNNLSAIVTNMNSYKARAEDEDGNKNKKKNKKTRTSEIYNLSKSC